MGRSRLDKLEDEYERLEEECRLAKLVLPQVMRDAEMAGKFYHETPEYAKMAKRRTRMGVLSRMIRRMDGW